MTNEPDGGLPLAGRRRGRVSSSCRYHPCSCISIRKFPSHRYDIAGMIENGTMTRAGMIAGDCRLSRLNVLVYLGGTGSGKTTLLNALTISSITV